MEDNKLNTYEAMFLFSPNAGGGEGQTPLDIARTMIERHQGQIIVAKKWDERKLAYEIGKERRGLYIIIYFRAPSASITPLEREVQLSGEVMRIMVLRADHLSEKEMNAVEPQPIAPERSPEDRFDRGGDRGDRGGDRGPRRPRRVEEAPQTA